MSQVGGELVVAHVLFCDLERLQEDLMIHDECVLVDFDDNVVGKIILFLSMATCYALFD